MEDEEEEEMEEKEEQREEEVMAKKEEAIAGRAPSASNTGDRTRARRVLYTCNTAKTANRFLTYLTFSFVSLTYERFQYGQLNSAIRASDRLVSVYLSFSRARINVHTNQCLMSGKT